MDALLTIEEVREFLQITKSELEKLIDDGELEAFLIVGKKKVSREALDRYLSASRIGAMPARGRYAALSRLLDEARDDRHKVDFGTIDARLAADGQKGLPDAAKKYRAWWANSVSHSHSGAWLQRGWEVGSVDLDAEHVTFRRIPPESRSAVGRRLTAEQSKASRPTAADFRRALYEAFDTAAHSGEPSITINAGVLHRTLGGYPGPGHRMPICCSVMREMMGQDDVLIASPPQGNGARLTVEYHIPRPSSLVRTRAPGEQ